MSPSEMMAAGREAKEIGDYAKAIFLFNEASRVYIKQAQVASIMTVVFLTLLMIAQTITIITLK